MNKTIEVCLTIHDDEKGTVLREVSKQMLDILEGSGSYPFPGRNIDLSPQVTLWNVSCIESVEVDYDKANAIKVRYVVYEESSHLDEYINFSYEYKCTHYLGMTPKDVADAQAEMYAELDSLKMSGYGISECLFFAPYISSGLVPTKFTEDESTETMARKLLGLNDNS